MTANPRRIVTLLVLALAAAACVNTPLKTAQTAEQKVYVLESEYNIVLEDALTVARNPDVSQAVRSRIQMSVARASQVIASLDVAMEQALVEKQKFAANGGTSLDKIEAAANNLNGWLAEAEKAVADLKSAAKMR